LILRREAVLPAVSINSTRRDADATGVLASAAA
jgi:hypothetical protein